MTNRAGEAALVLVGHGSARHQDAARPILNMVEAIRADGPFAEVGAAFLKGVPTIDQALTLVRADTVVVVPVFAGRGYYTDVLIPRALGLDGTEVHPGGRRVLYTAPVGEHPHLPDLLANRALGVAAAAGFDPASASLLLIAHGSSRPGGAGTTPRAIAAALASRTIFGEVSLAFLEQEPRATGWPAFVSHRDVVVLPLLVAQGMHASEDIPPLFGMGPDETGTVEAAGHRVRLAGGLGTEPELMGIITAMAEAALATSA